MGMEMRQELKLSQQLVMTPQLQQAIRLLQLSRMELADLVHEEMLENPILDDELDLENERTRERDEAGSETEQLHQLEGAGSTETPIEGSVQDGVAQTEIKGDASAVIAWSSCDPGRWSTRSRPDGPRRRPSWSRWSTPAWRKTRRIDSRPRAKWWPLFSPSSPPPSPVNLPPNRNYR